jgi:hypothetical protein
MSAGILVRFQNEAALREALTRLRADRIDNLETYTPKPLEDESASSPLPAIVLLAGVLGSIAAFAMQALASTRAYPEDIGGRPLYSWRAFIPITFEVGILFAVLAGVFGYLVLNRMPSLYRPIDELDSMRYHSMRSGWLVAIRPAEPALLARARGLIEPLEPLAIEEIAE